MLNTVLGDLHSAKRRQILIEAMERNFKNSCQNCLGECCTFTSNSMQITPVEAYEIVNFMGSGDNRLNLTVIEKLNFTIEHYRLNSRHPTRGHFLRRNYTCPFFNNCEFGCSLPKELKPYGCLAFNKEMTRCHSDEGLLQVRESQNLSLENELNKNLIKMLNLDWIKAPLPIAILELIKKLEVTDSSLRD